MKVLHTSDLHLGKRIFGVSMADDQRFILDRMVGIVERESPDALIVAGDVYDRAVPSEEAVTMFGEFLSRVSDLGCRVFVIAGNHDSGARLDFCGPVLGRQDIHVAGEFTGRAEKVTVADGIGEVDVWLLPYFRVSEARARLGVDAQDYVSAMRAVLEASGVDPDRRNVLVAHQFFSDGVSLPALSDSEDQVPEVGGIACIPASELGMFDYVALGHLHIPQSVGRETVRYSGSPLMYSASETGRAKSVTVAEVRGKGDVEVSTIPLEPARRLRVIRGRAEELVAAGLEEKEGRDDYVIAQLSEPPGSWMRELSRVYPNLLNATVARQSGSGTVSPDSVDPRLTSTPAEMFARFYREVTGEDLTPYQREILDDCIADRRDGE